MKLCDRHAPSNPISDPLVACVLLALVACGSSPGGEEPNDRRPSPSSAPAASTPAPSGSSSPSGPPPEALEAVTEAFGMAADQVRAACGPAFDTCDATPGCDEILRCAATNGCAGSACYCADASCASPGPCRSVIDGAPGARTPDVEDPSLGPAPDAASAVGACLQGLAGGGEAPVPGGNEVPTESDASAPDAADAG